MVNSPWFSEATSPTSGDPDGLDATTSPQTDGLASPKPVSAALRGATYEALSGLLAATGLRVSEEVHLTDADVDLKSGVLTVCQTKFVKSPKSPSPAASGHGRGVEALSRAVKYSELRQCT
jgi:hypothetical protein